MISHVQVNAATTVDSDISNQALAVLIQSAKSLKLNGDVAKNETLGSIIVLFLFPIDKDASVTNRCSLSSASDLLDCTLSYSSRMAEQELVYQVKASTDLKSGKVNVGKLATKDVEVGRGGP
jgi:hypothetical protein